MHTLGRRSTEGAVGWLGRYRAWDGSTGARVGLDLDGPHAVAVVGKRGSGKSHTLGVLAEELRATDGVVPVVVDPMGALGELPGAAFPDPVVAASAVPPRAWPGLLGLEPAAAAGALVWRAAAAADTLEGMCEFVADAPAERGSRRAARNHLRLAEAWGVFDPDGLTAPGLTDQPTVLDCSGLARAPSNAVVRAVADALYDARVEADGPLPWLLVDEAHAFLDGTRDEKRVAAPALRRLLTRGRQPGVSLVLATQRPAALPDVAVSQSDLLIAHRLTGEADRQRLAAARPGYLTEALSTRLPERPGEALVVDDASEQVHPIQVRERRGTHGGAAPRAGERASSD
jgi:phosphoglycolate phosphatase-like HAD superfamily hydrolase